MDSSQRAIARLIMWRNPGAIDGSIPHAPRTFRTHSQLGAFGEVGHIGVSDLLEAVALNPQPLPPRERYAFAVASALIETVMSYAQLSEVLGAAVANNAERFAIQAVEDFEELCPRLPKWPFSFKFGTWPPPPPPPPDPYDEMSFSELMVVASNLLVAAETLGAGSIAEALDRSGTRIMEQALARA
ncbi:MAG TPA: hypothetical protein PLX85_05425 [Dehalococcoidia bacterium]|nr:hypothetical protein [Dehalococcoidia bacterium]